MPDEDDNPTTPQEPPTNVAKPGWNRIWQAPVLVGGALLLGLGVVRAISTTPDPVLDPLLDRSEALIERERYEDAIELLNTRVYPWITGGENTSDTDRIRYHLAKARAIGRGQREGGFELDENHEAVIREYRRAEDIGAVLGARDLAALARAFMGTGRIDRALDTAARIPDDAAPRRIAIRRDAVEDLLDRPSPDRARATEVLTDLLLEPALTPEDEVWAMERSAGIRLDQGYIDETISRILKAMPRIERAGVAGRARLHLLLARAYTMNGALEQARRQAEYASELSGASDPHYPEVLLAKARVEDLEGDTRAARDLYAEIVQRHSRSRVYPRALLGLGETEAALGEIELSTEAYGTLVESYDTLGISTDPSRREITRSLLDRAGDTLSLGRPQDAIAYTRLADGLYPGDREIPPGVLEMFTLAHTARARDILGRPIEKTRSLLGLDPSTRAEVQRHLLIAAANARMHAERFVVTDIDRFAESLWRAADLFDRAGDHREAIQAFRTYADTLRSDPRYAESLFRLAEALRSTGEYGEASEIYKRLLDERGGALGADIGRFADESRVPLAQAYIYDEDPGNDAKAERLLVDSLDGSSDTGTRLYREALLELAGYYDRTGRDERAIERYEEYATRYEGDPRTASVVYKLADAHRRLADRIEPTLDEPMPKARRRERAAAVREHRELAIKRYEQAIVALSELEVRQTGLYESTALRNAYFYLADCHYDLGDYDEAIRRYDIARDRYSGDPASLIAMVQIVNAYLERGEFGRARTANERAKRFYNSMPAEVWDDPDLPMDRADWERWLDSSSTLLTRAPAP